MATTSEAVTELSALPVQRWSVDGPTPLRSALAFTFVCIQTEALVSMARNDEELQILRKEILHHEKEVAVLKSRLSQAETLGLPKDDAAVPNGCTVTPPDSAALAADQSGITSTWSWPLSREEYKRYGRQMITPEIGLEGKRTVAVTALSGLTTD